MWGWHRSNGEEGASATLFIIALTALLGVALLALDAGSLFVSRRGQIADTDAGALAAASRLIEQPCTDDDDAAVEAEAYVQTNDATTTVDAVTVERDQPLPCHPAGTVTVETSHPAQLYFAPLFGYDAIDTAVTSRVRFGQLIGTGVRPLGFCSTDAHYVEWLDYLQAVRDENGAGMSAYEALPTLDPDNHPNHLYPGAANVVHHIEIEKVPTTTCATRGPSGKPEGNGNWGYIDFDGGGGAGGVGNAEFKDRLVNGYVPGVHLGDPGLGDNDCDAADADVDEECPARPGAGGGSFDSQMSAITCGPNVPTANEPTEDCEDLGLVLFAVVYDVTTGDGSNTRYRLTGLVQFVLRGFSGKVTGGPGDYIDVEFVSERVEGPVGGFDPESAAPLVATMCGTGGFDNCG